VKREDLIAWMKGRRKTRGKAIGEEHAASTIRNDVSRISVLYALAATPEDEKYEGLWGWGLTGLINPASGLPLPKLPGGRERRLGTVRKDGTVRKEEDLIMERLAAGPDPAQMLAFFAVALATGMRRSEILDIRVGQCVQTEDGPECWRPTSKNRAPRRVLLTRRADAALQGRINEMAHAVPTAKVFTLNGDAVAWRWDSAMKHAGIVDLHIHDIRHEALSRLAARGFTIAELKRQSGHKSDAALLRYVNAVGAEMRRKLEDPEGAPRPMQAA
jgi:integrase